jgi:pimeloyl-ACP methyl ester carboxylesterase
MTQAVNAIVSNLDAAAQRTETPCGDGVMVWRSWGQRDHPPLLLFHGGAGSWQHWVKSIPAFSSTRRVVVPDLPGLGESANPPAPADMPAIAQVVAAGIDAVLGADASYHLVGFSWGASVGAHVALLHGARVRSLILLGAGGLVKPRTPIKLERVRDKTGDELMAAHRTNLLRSMLAKPESADDLAVSMQAYNASRTRLDTPAIIATRPLAQSLPQLTIPVHAIWGELDQVAYYTLADRIAALRELRPGIEPYVIPGCGHWATYEAPQAFNTLVADLLRAA